MNFKIYELNLPYPSMPIVYIIRFKMIKNIDYTNHSFYFHFQIPSVFFYYGFFPYPIYSQISSICIFIGSKTYKLRDILPNPVPDGFGE